MGRRGESGPERDSQGLTAMSPRPGVSRWASVAARQAARRRFEQPAETKKVFGPAFFKRLVGMEGAKPLLRFPQKAKSNSVAPRAQPKNRERRPAGRPRMSPRPQFQRNCGMTHPYSIQILNRASESKRLSFLPAARFIVWWEAEQDCVLRGTP